MKKFYSNIENLVPDKDFIQVNKAQNGTYTISSKLACNRLYSCYTVAQMQFISKRFVLGMHQLKHFFECLILEVEDEFLAMPDGLENALFASALYRVYYHFTAIVMHDFVGKRGKDPSSYKMMGSAFLRWLLCSKCLNDVAARNVHIALPTLGSVKAVLDSGLVFSDFNDTISALQKINVELYRTAVLQGVRMNSRDWFCMELASDINGSPRNHLNFLRNNWQLKKHYSSWCTITPVVTGERMTPGQCLLTRSVKTIVKRFNDHFKKNQSATRETFYAQINIYMVLALPTDTFLDRRAFASVTCRHADGTNPRKILCRDIESFEPRIAFVPIKDIKAIRYGVVAYDRPEAGFPFGSHNSMVVGKGGKFYSTADQSTADHLIMVDLDPNEDLHDAVRGHTFKMGSSPYPSVAQLLVAKCFYE